MVSSRHQFWEHPAIDRLRESNLLGASRLDRQQRHGAPQQLHFLLALEIGSFQIDERSHSPVVELLQRPFELAPLRAHASGMEPVLYREEALGLIFAVHDILEEVRAIHELLEDEDGGEEEKTPEE